MVFTPTMSHAMHHAFKQIPQLILLCKGVMSFLMAVFDTTLCVDPQHLGFDLRAPMLAKAKETCLWQTYGPGAIIVHIYDDLKEKEVRTSVDGAFLSCECTLRVLVFEVCAEDVLPTLVCIVRPQLGLVSKYGLVVTTTSLCNTSRRNLPPQTTGTDPSMEADEEEDEEKHTTWFGHCTAEGTLQEVLVYSKEKVGPTYGTKPSINPFDVVWQTVISTPNIVDGIRAVTKFESLIDGPLDAAIVARKWNTGSVGSRL